MYCSVERLNLFANVSMFYWVHYTLHCLQRRSASVYTWINLSLIIAQKLIVTHFTHTDTFPQATPPQAQVLPLRPDHVELLPSPTMPLPPVSAGRLSPLMWEETEGSKVSERISQAWVLSDWTRSMLGNHQPGAHLTCPAIMTDIKLVSWSVQGFTGT